MNLKILNINGYMVLEGTPILNVLKKLTEKARNYPFLIVVNKKRSCLYHYGWRYKEIFNFW